jgi:hypothetical protein
MSPAKVGSKPKAGAARGRKPAPRPTSKPARAGWWRDLRLALLLAVPVVGFAVVSRPVPPPKEAHEEAYASVQIPEADRSRIDSWARFFACYNLTSPQDVMTATLEGAGYAKHPQWRPDAMIRVPLAPPRMTPTKEEAAVLLEAERLAQQHAVAGDDPCR